MILEEAEWSDNIKILYPSGSEGEVRGDDDLRNDTLGLIRSCHFLYILFFVFCFFVILCCCCYCMLCILYYKWQ